VSSHVIGIPVLLFLTILVLFVVRSRRVGWFDFVILVLWGVYLGSSSFAQVVNSFVLNFAHIFGGGSA
jgi:hypothetical protein